MRHPLHPCLLTPVRLLAAGVGICQTLLIFFSSSQSFWFLLSSSLSVSLLKKSKIFLPKGLLLCGSSMRRKSESILYQLCPQSSLGRSCVLEPAKRRFTILHHRFLLNSRAVLHQHINWLSICNSTDNTFSPFSPDFVDGRKISWTISGAFSGKNIDDTRRAPLLAGGSPLCFTVDHHLIVTRRH